MTPNARFADLRGASVFITGGGSGIGAALSEGFVGQGAKVAFIQRSDAREFGVDKIRVNAIAPGWVMTDKQREMWVTKDALAAHLERQCLKRELLPNDIVPTALFLASKSSDMLSGQVIAVDGGVVVTG